MLPTPINEIRMCKNLLSDAGGDCSKDEDPKLCRYWASQGECTKNPLFMLQKCPDSCGVAALHEGNKGAAMMTGSNGMNPMMMAAMMPSP